MRIEFATSVDDYSFSEIPDKVIKILKDKMVSTMLFERIPVLKYEKAIPVIETQSYWSLI